MSLKETISKSKIEAMKAKDKERNGTLTLIMAAIKQYEVDNRTEANDEVVLSLLNKMIKQRQDSVAQYEKAGREDLAKKEMEEMVIIREYLPKQLSDEEVESVIKQVIAETGASTSQDLKKVMPVLKEKLNGKADMSKVSQKVKQMLA